MLSELKVYNNVLRGYIEKDNCCLSNGYIYDMVDIINEITINLLILHQRNVYKVLERDDKKCLK